MGSTYTYNLPPSTTASLARKIDLGLINASNIVSDPDRPITAEVQRFIKDHIASKAK